MGAESRRSPRRQPSFGLMNSTSPRSNQRRFRSTRNQPSLFEDVDDRHARWTQAKDPWLFGCFRYLWADATIRVWHIDTAARTLAFDEACHYSRPGGRPP